MTKPFSLINELENQDTDPAHLKRNKIVSLLKKKFDFENSHLKSPNGKEKGIVPKISMKTKCVANFREKSISFI